LSQDETRELMRCIYKSLQEHGDHPVDQIIGYLLSEDPTYITNYNNARQLIRKIDRDTLLRDIVQSYFS
jgi:uncharacterized protein (UPF0297 family)